MVSIFFDLEKGYDTTWKYGIVKNLHDMDVRGLLPLFIQNFLSERKFRKRVGTSLSDFYDQEIYGSSPGEHFICHPFYCRNQQHHQLY